MNYLLHKLNITTLTCKINKGTVRDSIHNDANLTGTLQHKISTSEK